MKRHISIVFVFLSVISVISYEKIVTWKDEQMRTEKLTYDGSVFFSDQNKKTDARDVSYINFNLKDGGGSEGPGMLEDITPQELMQRAESMEKKYPDSSLLVLYDDGIEKLDRDGTRITRSRYAVKIMNEKELSYSILSFYYVKVKYESRIIMARSISPDGKVQYLNRSDITMTTPKQGLGFFSGRKDEFIIRAQIPGVTAGSIVDFEWDVTESSPEDPDQFYTKWFFGGDKPVYSSTVRYIVPSDKKLYWTAKNFEPYPAEPVIKEEDGYTIYFFERGECPPFEAEPYAPHMEELIPFVFGSTFPDQTYLSGWLARFMKERMVHTRMMEITVYDVLEKDNAVTEEERTAALYRFVQEHIHYRSIKTSLSSGLSGHPAPQTFENKYGDCIDKSILFSTLLKIAGIEAYPVVVSTNDNPRPLYGEIGVVTGNHAITEIHLKEEGERIIYLDPTGTSYRYPSFRSDDQGIPAWNPILDTVREIKPVDPEWNTQQFSKRIFLSSDNTAKVQSLAQYAGDWEAGIRSYFISIKKEEIKALLGKIISNDYPGSVLKDYHFSDPSDYKKPLSLSLEYEAGNILKSSGEFGIMNLPVNYDLDYLALEERKYPLVFNTTDARINNIEIIVPEGTEAMGLPSDLVIKNKHFTYEGRYISEGGRVFFKDHFVRTGCRIEPEDYKVFRKDLLDLDHFMNIPLVFKQTAGSK